MNPLSGLPNHTRIILLFLAFFFLVGVPITSYTLSRNRTAILKSSPVPKPTLKPISPVISIREKQQIDAWIKKNNLNQYGDPIDTAYPGGTPLFNEATGQTIDRYVYITKQHPDRPWCTPRPACLDSTPRCLIAETADMCPPR